MMPTTWKRTLSIARSERLAHHQDLPLPVDIRPLRSARRLRLRIDDRRGVLKLTCPWRMSRRSALRWAVEQRHWVDAQLAALEATEPFLPGATIPVDGVDVRLEWREGAARTPTFDGAIIACGGAVEGFARRIEGFLKKRALQILSAETAGLADAAGLAPRSISVGDAETRWGSCSASGRIRFSWRLALAPPDVRRYVIVHELAHLVHLNHGPQFKALERQLFGGDVAAARASLVGIGPRLKRVGRRF